MYEKLYRQYIFKYFRDMKCFCCFRKKNITSGMVRSCFLPAQGWVNEVRVVSATDRRSTSIKRRKIRFLNAVCCQNFSNKLPLANQNQQHWYCFMGISLALYVHETWNVIFSLNMLVSNRTNMFCVTKLKNNKVQFAWNKNILMETFKYF